MSNNIKLEKSFKFTEPRAGVVGKMNTATLEDYISTMSRVFIATKSLQLILNDEKSAVMPMMFKDYSDSGDYECRVLDAVLDLCETDCSTKSTAYALAKSTAYLATTNIKVCSLKGLNYFMYLKSKCEKIAETYVPLTDAEIEEFKKYTTTICSLLSYSLVYELELYNIIKKGVDCSLPLAYYNFCKKEDLKLEDLSSLLIYEFSVNKPLFGVFEDYPELAEKFVEKFDEEDQIEIYSMVDLITIEDIRDILEGRAVPDMRFIAELRSRGGDN